MSSILAIMEKDVKLLLRNAIFWVITVTLVIIVILIAFVIPKDTAVADQTIVTYGIPYDLPGPQILESAEAVEQAVSKTGAIGLLLKNGSYTLVHQGLSPQAAAAAASLLIPPEKELPETEVHLIRVKAEPIAVNLKLVPVFICFEAVILGFLMVAVLMLDEKQENVLKAYRISPSGTFLYVSSKVVLMSTIGTFYAVLMTIFTVGWQFNWMHFLLLSLLGCAMYSALGMCLAVFFRDISGWFFAAVLILGLNMLPMVSYSMPTFSPSWITAIPSYASVFAFGEILFPTGKSLWSTFTLLFSKLVLVLLLCSVLVKRKLLTANRGGI